MPRANKRPHASSAVQGEGQDVGDRNVRGKAAFKGNGKEQGKGNDKSDGKEQSKGKDKGKDKAKDKDTSEGKGKGKDKGKDKAKDKDTGEFKGKGKGQDNSSAKPKSTVDDTIHFGVVHFFAPNRPDEMYVSEPGGAGRVAFGMVALRFRSSSTVFHSGQRVRFLKKSYPDGGVTAVDVVPHYES